MKRYHIILIIVLISTTAYSQFADDALRFSQVYYQGTARNMAVGGAFGALGADFSTASTNPAGMGLFRTGEFVFTPEVASRKASSIYNGSIAENSRTIMDISNMGYVIVKPIGSKTGWKYFQFGFGMNRLNNFNSRVIMEGENIENSKLDVYTELADGQSVDELDDFELYPAWECYLLNPYGDDQYYTPVPFGGVMQQQIITTRGSINEWLMSFSGNYNDKLFVGATIGLPYLRYYRESSYSEYDDADTIPYFDNWSITENLATTGWGINLKLGAIIKPVEWLRIGAAFHTPTYYWSMSDTWFTNTTSYVQTYVNDSTDDLEWVHYSYESPVGNYDYHLATPLRAIGSVSFLIGQYGFISGEYEYANYSSAKLSSRYDSFSAVNQDIKTSFKATHNFRAGTEWRFSNFSFRGGYALYGSPYSNNINDGKRQMYSGGIGYKTRYYAIDFAYVYSIMNEDYYMYTSNIADYNPNAVDNQFTTSSFVLSARIFIN
jgi:hypothetical protein